jgi:hypothetical protein
MKYLLAIAIVLPTAAHVPSTFTVDSWEDKRTSCAAWQLRIDRSYAGLNVSLSTIRESGA